MKKSLFFILTVLISLTSWGQNNAKLSSELQKELNNRTSSSEQFRVLIVMAEEYDQVQMTRQIQYMEKAERRAFVVNELQRFSRASQNDIMQVLEEGANNGLVRELTPFWISNSIGCTMTRNMINTISQRNDILVIESDEYRNMLPNGETSTPVQNSISNSGNNGSTSSTRGVAWHVSQVNADDVWNYNGSSGYNGNGIIVAILDTGVNYNHNDIKNNMWTNSQGYHGYDYVNRDNDPMDDQGHGSHCAGIVAGTGASGTKTGMAPGAKIMALKVLGADGSGSNSNIMNAMQYAITNQADIVSMSLGASGDSGNASERQIFNNMLSAGMIATLAAGNDGENYSNANPNDNGYYYSVPRNVGSPGNCPPPWHNPDQTLSGGLSAVVCVGASQRNDRKSTFSSMGPVTWSGVSGYNDYPYTAGSSTNIGLIRPDIAVPGSDITSLNYSGNSGYTEMAGTSMATPGCAGIFALMLSANPNLTPAQLDEIIETTAIPSDFQTCKNNNTGAGRADALAAIDAIFTTATKPTNLSLTTCGGNVNLTWTASNAPAGYCIYRDNVQVASNVNGTTYTDENVGVGKHIYYVRANDGSNRQSVHSNCVVCTIEPYATIPIDFGGELNNNTIDLIWGASEASNAPTETTLCFTDDPYTAYGSNGSSTINFGVRYLPEDLVGLKGMSIDQVSLPILTTGISYTLRIFRGTTYSNTTGAAVYTQSFTPTSGNWEYQTMNLNTPYVLDDVSQDLWITFSAKTNSGGGYPMVVGQYDGPSSNCFYQAYNSDVNGFVWTHYPDYGSNYNYALCIKTHLTRTTTYTPLYNVYRNGESLAQNLIETNYHDASPTTINNYYITSKVAGNESCPSDILDMLLDGIEITATINPSTGGTITGAGLYLEGATATLSATPNIGYVFVNWTENNQVVSTNATFSFTVSEPRTLVANFQSIPQNNIAYASVENGTISGPTAAYPSETVTLTASPASGYILASWNVYKTGDASTTITVENDQFVMPDYDVTVSAEFVVNPEYSINLACSITYGSISVSHASATAGTTVTLSATPIEGYELNSWIVLNANNPNMAVNVNNNNFIMPNYDVNVSALFTAEEVEDTFFVGTEESLSENSNIPTNLYYNYSLSQSIYTPAQLGAGACTITHIAYYYNATTAADRDVDIYMSHTTTSSFNSTKAWIKPSNSDEVFSGTFSIAGEEGWNLIELDTPFEYNGTDNLVITFDDNSGNYKSSNLNFYTFNSGNNSSIYYCNDNTNPNPTNVTQIATGRLAYIPILALVLDVEQHNSANLTAMPCELSGLDYIEGNGPSEAKPVTIITYNHDDGITATAPDNFEISKTPSGNFSPSIFFPNPWLHYDDGTYATSVGAGGTIYWGSMFPSDMLADFAGGSLSKVALYSNGNAEGTFTVNIYRGGETAPETLVYTQDFSLGSNYGLNEIILSTPVAIDHEKNLWITFYQSGIDYPACACVDMGDLNNRWASTDGEDWFDLADAGLSGYSWIIRGYVDMGLRGNQMVELPEFNGNSGGEISAKHYIDKMSNRNRNQPLPAGITITQVYTRLKANLPEGQYNDETLTITSGETSAEVTLNGEVTNPLHIVPDNQTINGDLVLDASNRYLITETGIMTVNGNLTCNDPSLLVIEDGGQLYCNNANVQATFHKIIEKNTDDTDGWYTIASPMSDPTIQNLTVNTFDIYAYDEDADQEEWQNYRVNPFQFLPGHGYLYANSAATGEENTDLIMTGTLTPSNTPITIDLGYAASYEGVRGFNLIGNPYSHNISMSDVKVNGVAITEFYRLSNDNQLIRFTSGEILPGESFFIRATAAGQSVVIGGE